MNVETLMRDLKNQFVSFVETLSIEDVSGMCAGRENIFFYDCEFYTAPRGMQDNRGGLVVYDSEGQADVLTSPVKLKEQLIEDAEFLLQRVIFDEPN